MAFAGRVALVLALVVSVYGIGAALYGGRRGRRDWVDSGRRSIYCLAAILTVAMAILEVAFIRNDFSYNTVANTSSTTTPLLYRAAAHVVVPGGIAAAVGLAALDLGERGDLHHAQPPARHRALRDERAARLRRLLHDAAGVLRLAVRADERRRR